MSKAVDEPVLLCKEDDGYLFFSISSDGMLNYKVASKVSGSMTRYLVDPTSFNPEKAPVVVLSSPNSGAGQAGQSYTKVLLPILKHFRIAHSHISLTDEKTAEYLATNGQFTPGTIFILLCGDGVIHEVVNGLGQNPHFAQDDTPIRLCPIPCGTGNGLAASLKIMSIAQGIRATFKGNFQPFPVMQVHCPSLTLPLYSTVVVSYGLHAAIVRECSADTSDKTASKFQEAAKRQLYPSPFLYQADLMLKDACKFPDFSKAQEDAEIGDGQHTYCLITRCSNLEGEWKIAPLANPLSENHRLDVVRMAEMSGSELQTILMDGYKAGAQINRANFEYYRASTATLHIHDPDSRRRVLCVDGAIHTLSADDTVQVSVVDSIGPSRTRLLLQRLQ